ncbi:hypothetical protein [Crateriforma conspicua]|uniref:Uncharacterized protein n=1 Tax=Crateriforma conspicua TaxID=2527996 RepID=A0A5C6FGJ0_9PLAN|nr:hypothetical protein [Crateriforma conspicua]TWU59665.1 hypothetical protein V7x_54390 [Crateriforma conspicua]
MLNRRQTAAIGLASVLMLGGLIVASQPTVTLDTNVVADASSVDSSMTLQDWEFTSAGRPPRCRFFTPPGPPFTPPGPPPWAPGPPFGISGPPFGPPS